MQILYVISEVAPWIKTGGLADVAASLPKALRQADVDIRLLVPGYADLLAQTPSLRLCTTLHLHDVPGRILETCLPGGVTAYVLACPGFSDRHGNPYMKPDGHAWDDNAQRFNRLALAAVAFANDLLPFRPHVLHLNDWQTGLVPVHLKQQPPERPVKTIFTIHNLAYQGVFPAHLLSGLGIQPRWMTLDGLEFYGQISFIKGGIALADHITTVSPSYAQEIQTPAYGEGLDGLLRHRARHLSGILNGIDTELWNPETDPYLDAHYTVQHLQGKKNNKKALRRSLGFPKSEQDIPLVAMISRLAAQKGVDLVIAALPELMQRPIELVILGSGDSGLEEALQRAIAPFSERIALRLGYDEAMAHRIEAGADMFLMPSRFEPCGLNQLYSLRYGTVPIARATGGLRDTIVDATAQSLAKGTASGILFEEPSARALLHAVDRALTLYHDRKTWQRMMRCGMAIECSWSTSAAAYLQLYRELLARPWADKELII
jgi:starch synthase